jgi:hypothetical protein
MKIQIISHTTQPSESVKRLEEELNIDKDVLLLNYGKCVSKLKQYEFFKSEVIPHPEWTTDVVRAGAWLSKNECKKIVGRRRIKSQTGTGACVITSLDALEYEHGLNPFKVFTKYIPKKREFRVNIFKDKIVNIREKVRKVGATGLAEIRSQSNGYTTVKLQSPAPPGLEELALRAAKVSLSDFKGVDIGYNQLKNLLFVLEVNSGPSIEGASIKEYAQAINKFVTEVSNNG